MKISSLNIYPIKSLGGINLNQSEIAITGLRYDRNWMLVDIDGRFITQRQIPLLATLKTQILNSQLHISAPNGNAISVDLDVSGQETCSVKVWSDHCLAYDCGSTAGEYFTDLLEQHHDGPIKLVRFDSAANRPIPAKHQFGTEAHTKFADGYPILVVSQESLDDLNSRLEAEGATKLPMNRFRPNIVIKGLGAYSEDKNPTLKFANGIEIKLVSPCTRCKITTIDQITTKTANQPLAIFSQYRKNPEGKGVVFGQNAILLKSTDDANLSVGDSFTV